MDLQLQSRGNTHLTFRIPLSEKWRTFILQLRLWIINRTATIMSLFNRSSIYYILTKPLTSFLSESGFDIMVTSSDSLHTSSFTYLIISKKCHIYDAMSSKSTHLSISQKSLQYKFWHVSHQYFMRKPLRFFVSTPHRLFPNRRRSSADLYQGPFLVRILPDGWTWIEVWFQKLWLL